MPLSKATNMTEQQPSEPRTLYTRANEKASAETQTKALTPQKKGDDTAKGGIGHIIPNRQRNAKF